MNKTLEAVFDGKVFRPDEEIELEPNTRVEITVKIKSKSKQKPKTGSLSDIKTEAFVGMWRDREEMNDSSSWVRGVRETHWNK